MKTKDIDFTNVSLPADEFDAMMRRALDAPAPKPSEDQQSKPVSKKSRSNPKSDIAE